MTVFANAINSTIGASISGATNTLTITNPSNTASSQALCLATVGGGTAGDSYYQAIVSGVTTWSWGVDNSDTDAFVVAASAALGTTNIMHSTTAGEINYPLQPAFSATVSGAQDNVTGAGATYTVLYPIEIFDANSDFSSPNFTAPVTGHYFFSGSARFDQLAATGTYGNVQVSTSNRGYVNFANNVGALRDLNNQLTGATQAYADMDTGDIAQVTVLVQNMAGNTVDIHVASTFDNNFSGFLHS